MVRLAGAFVIGWVKEQLDVALMWLPMVDHCCNGDPAHGLASFA